jgi:hypothetical protein
MDLRKPNICEWRNVICEWKLEVWCRCFEGTQNKGALDLKTPSFVQSVSIV